MHDDLRTGEMIFDFLAREANTIDQYSFDFSGYSPLPGDAYGTMDLLSPSPSTGYPTPFNTPYVPASILWYVLGNLLTPYFRDELLYFSSPSPSLSQTSSTPEPRQLSLELSPTPEPSCRRAVPVKRGKWHCSSCNTEFRGKWECKRHIKAKGKQVMCLGCGGHLLAREDSLLRHFKKYCKQDLETPRFEDSFVEV